MNAEPILRELGAEPRRFATVASALFWWLHERERRRTVRSLALEPATGSRPTYDCRDATYARITACLAPRSPEDHEADRKLTVRRLANLVAWYESTDFQTHAFSAGCKKTRNQIRRRMLARGVLCL